MSITDSNVLIIEHSIPVNLLLTQYLKRMGFSKILVCENAESGIKTFEGLALEKRDPIVFLGYHLPDNTAAGLISKLFAIAPDVKIIIETSLDRKDPKIRQLFSMGVFHYLQKPLRLSSVNHVLETIQKEVDEFNNIGIDGRRVLEMLRSLKKTSVVRLAEYCNYDPKSLLPFLRRQQEKSVIYEVSKIREIGCRDCNSVNNISIFSCDSCGGQNFRRDTLIEHYDCGNISTHDTYDNEQCPKCNKRIKIIGGDYRVMNDFYICNECDQRFQTPHQNFICSKCGSKFSLDEANWIESKVFCFTNNQNETKPFEEQSEFSEIDTSEDLTIIQK